MKNWRKQSIEEDTPGRVLTEVFGHSHFHGLQEEVIRSTLVGKDALYIAPTGSGKSLCFQLPAVMAERGKEVSVVISPLIALMRDQVRGLKERKIPAIDVHHQSRGDRDKIMEDIRNGVYALVYLSPEQLGKGDIIHALQGIAVQHLAVDEAHCISEWGHDFRPDYGRLGSIVNEVAPGTVGAYTATASPRVESDIKKVLQISDDSVHREDPYRSNLEYGITHIKGGQNKDKILMRLIDHHAPNNDDGVIVYCGTRAMTEDVRSTLRRKGLPVENYHGEMGMRQRKRLEEGFLANNPRVLAATNALGMGMDKQNTRLIVHYSVPGSVQSYMQETGRAGRDGEPAHCHLLYDPSDLSLQRYFIENKSPAAHMIRGVYRVLEDLGKYAKRREQKVFTIDLFAFYRRFDQTDRSRGVSQTVTRELKVNSALSILEHVGAITRHSPTRIELHKYPNELHSVVATVRDTRKAASTMCLEQMIQYAEDNSSDQRMLIDLLNQDGNVDDTTASNGDTHLSQ